jgi:2-C-methyl-D-erythritol 4-phosphate cytidylyltransferase
VADRWESVRNAMEHVPEDATHIAVHDAARPGVSGKLLDRVFAAARTLGAVVPAVDIAGTVKRVSGEVIEVSEDEDAVADSILGESTRPTIATRTVEATVDRSNLVEVQTPQVFEIGLLRRAYSQDDLTGATDDASLIERLGETVHVVEGESSNIKVTTPADLVLMRAILGLKPPAERPAHKRF